MNTKTDITLQEALTAAFQATLNGDYAARDVWCALIERQMNGRPYAPVEEPIEFGKSQN